MNVLGCTRNDTVVTSGPYKLALTNTGNVFISFRSKVLFGQDSVSGCTFKVKRSDLAKECSSLKDKMLHLLLGSPTHEGINRLDKLRVATFGNSDPQHPGDWVKAVVSRGPRDHLAVGPSTLNRRNSNASALNADSVNSPPGTCR